MFYQHVYFIRGSYRLVLQMVPLAILLVYRISERIAGASVQAGSLLTQNASVVMLSEEAPSFFALWLRMTRRGRDKVNKSLLNIPASLPAHQGIVQGALSQPHALASVRRFPTCSRVATPVVPIC